MKEGLLLGEIAFIAVAKRGGPVAEFRLDIVENL